MLRSVKGLGFDGFMVADKIHKTIRTKESHQCF